MSIRTTVTLDEDVIERVRLESRSRGESFRATLNELLRFALTQRETKQPRRFKVKAFPMGQRPGLNYDDVESLIEFSEGENHR